MAGDWLPFEFATLTKREVMLLSRRLGMSRDEAVGLCLRFWVWCSEQSENGRIEGVSAADVDALMGRPGFADALAAPEVGWLVMDAGGLTIPNWNRHLSKSAKARALSRERSAKYREKASD